MNDHKYVSRYLFSFDEGVFFEDLELNESLKQDYLHKVNIDILNLSKKYKYILSLIN